MAEDDFITRCRDHAELLEELATNHERIADIWAESKHAAFAAACRNGAAALKASADAAEEMCRDNEVLAQEDDPFREET